MLDRQAETRPSISPLAQQHHKEITGANIIHQTRSRPTRLVAESFLPRVHMHTLLSPTSGTSKGTAGPLPSDKSFVDGPAGCHRMKLCKHLIAF